MRAVRLGRARRRRSSFIGAATRRQIKSTVPRSTASAVHFAAIITAPENHAKLEYYRQLAVKLARAHGISDDEAKKRYPQGWKAPKPYLRIVPQPQ